MTRPATLSGARPTRHGAPKAQDVPHIHPLLCATDPPRDIARAGPGCGRYHGKLVLIPEERAR